MITENCILFSYKIPCCAVDCDQNSSIIPKFRAKLPSVCGTFQVGNFIQSQTEEMYICTHIMTFYQGKVYEQMCLRFFPPLYRGVNCVKFPSLYENNYSVRLLWDLKYIFSINKAYLFNQLSAAYENVYMFI